MTSNDLRKADELLRNFSGKTVKSACYAPFVSLYLTPTGEVLACCRNQTFILGDLRSQSLTEIWNGGRIAALRKALADYQFNLGCTYCEWESQRRGDSFAIRLMHDHLPVLSPEPEWPASIEFNGSNTCNLECIMCCGENSSSIRGNQQGLPPLPKIYDDRFFEEFRAFLPHLHFINFLGGEPFFSEETHRIWDMMIEAGLTIPCRVTTNGTQYNPRVERALKAIPMHITLSLDGVTKETYERVRHRANFETVISNLGRFHAYTRQRGTNFGISYCLMRQNWREVGDIALLAEKLDCELTISMVAGPSHCTLFTLPAHELRGIVGEIATISDKILPQLRRHRKAWEETIQHLQAATQPAQLQQIEKVMAYELLVDSPLALSRRLVEEGDYGKALGQLEGIRKGHADYYFALVLSGYIRGRQGDVEGARKDLEEALRISGKLPDAYLNLARIQFQQGRMKAALEDAFRADERVIPEDRVEPQLALLLAWIYASRWRLLPAFRALTRLARLPQPCREGISIPDSLAGAHRALAEIERDAGSLRSRMLAFWVYVLYRLAVRAQKAALPVRTWSFSRALATQSRSWRAASNGSAIDGLVPDGAASKARWTLRVAGLNNRATLVFPPDNPESVRIVIQEAGSKVTYDVQLNYGRIDFDPAYSYRVQFRVRADELRSLTFGIAMANAPWSNLGLYRTLEADPGWREIQEDFVPAAAEENARLHFDLGESGVSLEVASLCVTAYRLSSDTSTEMAEPPRSK